jgi:Tfp pilus assembly protein PilV
VPYGPLKKGLKNFCRLRITQRRAASGITLIEVSVSMMLLAIISIGVSALVKSGVEVQMARRVDMTMQSIGLNIVDDIRRDVQTADTATIANGGNGLTLVTPTGTIVYQLNMAGQFSRTNTGTGQSRIYNDPAQYTTPQFNVVCPQTCFTALQMNSDPVPMPKQIQVNEMQVQQQLAAGNAGSTIDRAFGPANFTVRQFTFNLMSATEFQ